MKQTHRVGGSLEKALNSGEGIQPGAALKEGWQLTKSSLVTFVGASVIALAAIFVILSLAMQLFLQGEVSLQDPTFLLIAMGVQIIVLAPLIGALSWMGVQHSVGRNTRPLDIFRFISTALPFIAAAALTSLANQLVAGVMPNIIGMLGVLYLNLSFAFIFHLIAVEKLGPLNAIRSSFVAANKRLGTFASVYVALSLLFLLSLFTFGLALIVAIPMYFNTLGVIYRDVFGVDDDNENAKWVKNVQDQPKSDQSDTWNA